MNTFARRIFALSLLLTVVIHTKAQDVPPNHLSFTEKSISVPFIWNGDTINGKWDEQAALLLPVKLEGCPRQFYMQFDLGSPYSLFYTNKLTAISERYKKTVQVTDSTKKLWDLSFKLGSLNVTASEIILRQLGNEGLSSDEKQVEIIGTIGTDLLDNREAAINYPGRSIMLNFHPKDSLQTVDLYYSRRSILFPTIVAGKKSILYFDTGSSAFELLTNKATVESLAPADAKPVTYKVNSWGKMLEAVTYPVKDSIEVGTSKLPLHNATYIEGASDTQVQQMMKMGIGGMTGNKLFLHSILFLDLKKKKFAVLPGNK